MWGLQDVDLVHHTQASNVTPVLQWLECDVMLVLCLHLYYGLCSSLHLNQQVKVRWWAGRPDKWAILHQATHLRLVQRFDTGPVQEITDASNAAQLPCSSPCYLLDVACV